MRYFPWKYFDFFPVSEHGKQVNTLLPPEGKGWEKEEKWKERGKEGEREKQRKIPKDSGGFCFPHLKKPLNQLNLQNTKAINFGKFTNSRFGN